MKFQDMASIFIIRKGQQQQMLQQERRATMGTKGESSSAFGTVKRTLDWFMLPLPLLRGRMLLLQQGGCWGDMVRIPWYQEWP